MSSSRQGSFTTSADCSQWTDNSIQETTGALLCGRNPATQAALSAQFSNGTIERKYLALVRGGEKSFSSQTMQIRTHIDYNDGNAFIPQEPSGKACETHLTVLATSVSTLIIRPSLLVVCRIPLTDICQPIAPLSLVQLEAKTGRKHQLRVHMAHIGGTAFFS